MINLVQTQIMYRVARISVTQLSADTWQLQTSNVRRFSFLSAHGVPMPVTITLDGFSFQANLGVAPSSFCQTAGAFTPWAVCDDAGKWMQSERSPLTFGPFRTVWVKQVSLIVGTQSADPSYTAWLLQEAAYWSQYWYYQGRGYMNIYTDNEYLNMTHSTSVRGSLPEENVLVFGDPAVNSFTAAVLANARSPLQLTPGSSSFTIGPRTFDQPCQGVLSLLPHPVYSATNLAGLVMGTDKCGMLDALRQLPMKSGELVPDWVVTSPDARWMGAGGYLAAGYWGTSWQWEPLTSYVT